MEGLRRAPTRRDPTRGSSRQESGKHVLGTALEHFRIVEASREVREHTEKRKGASDECYAAGEDGSPCLAMRHAHLQLARLSYGSDRRADS